MTDDERMVDIKRYEAIVKDTLMPMLSRDGKKGIVALRLFYVVAHGDGTASAGNIGAVAEGQEGHALMLIRSIIGLLTDLQDNREVETREPPSRH